MRQTLQFNQFYTQGGENMYSVAELAKMYGTSRDWMNTTLNRQELEEYLDRESKTKKLRIEGLPMLNLIVANSKTRSKDKDADAEPTDYENEYIEHLKKTIEKLEKEKEILNCKFDSLQDTFFKELEAQRQTMIILAPKKEEPRKNLFTRFFK